MRSRSRDGRFEPGETQEPLVVVVLADVLLPLGLPVRWQVALAALLLAGDAARLGLAVADLGAAAVLLEGGVEAAGERIQAAPRLLERARARRRRGRVAEEGAPRRVHLGLAYLVQVAEELEHLRAAAAGQLQCGRWLRRYCPNVCQSRRFCDSYRLARTAAAPRLSAAAAMPAISMAHSPPVHASQPIYAPGS